MPIKSLVVSSSLEAKGFKQANGDHSYYVYYSLAGKKSPVRTKISHGGGGKDISDSLVAKMAKQCHLTIGDFKDLIKCPLSRERYEAKLAEQGFVDS